MFVNKKRIGLNKNCYISPLQQVLVLPQRVSTGNMKKTTKIPNGTSHNTTSVLPYYFKSIKQYFQLHQNKPHNLIDNVKTKYQSKLK